MLSRQELIDAISQYISEHGIESILVSRNNIPLTPIESMPSYLTDHGEAKRFLKHDTRVSSYESLAEKVMPVCNDDNTFGLPKTSFINMRCRGPDEIVEGLQSFLRFHFNNPRLELRFSHFKIKELDREEIRKRFPFALGHIEEECLITIYNGDEGQSNSKVPICVSLKYLKANHYIIGADYSTISDIEIGKFTEITADRFSKKKSYTDSLCSRKIEGTFLFREGPELTSHEKASLAQGSPYVLLSLNSEISTLSTDLITSLFSEDWKLCSRDVKQQYAIKTIASLLTEGRLSYEDISIIDTSTSYERNPNNDCIRNLRHKCTATTSLGTDFHNVELDIECVASIRKAGSGTSRRYYIDNYSWKITSKNKRFLSAILGSDTTTSELNFHSCKMVTPDFLGRIFNENFRRYEEKKAALLSESITSILIPLIAFAALFSIVAMSGTIPIIGLFSICVLFLSFRKIYRALPPSRDTLGTNSEKSATLACEIGQENVVKNCGPRACSTLLLTPDRDRNAPDAHGTLLIYWSAQNVSSTPDNAEPSTSQDLTYSSLPAPVVETQDEIPVRVSAPSSLTDIEASPLAANEPKVSLASA